MLGLESYSHTELKDDIHVEFMSKGTDVFQVIWNSTGNPVPADYFDGLTGLGAIGTGAALRGNALLAGERPEGIASGGNRGNVNPVREPEPVKNPSNTVGTADALLPDADFQARLPSDAPAHVRPAGNTVYGLARQGVGVSRVGAVAVEEANRVGPTLGMLEDSAFAQVTSARQIDKGI